TPAGSPYLCHREPELKVPCFFHFLALAVCFSDRASCSFGEGRRQWLHSSRPNESAFLHETFPSDFLWGVGTSAHQTEGSWNQDGKGPSIWDHFTHTRGSSTADTASDSYVRWNEDVEAVAYLGTHFYAFSLSWPRLFPNGTGSPNAAGVTHYRLLIDRLKARGVQPVVTLFHWDLPQVLQERYGGWTNHSMVEIFAGYAAFCFQTFGGSVKYWLTMHNPYLMAVQGYGTGMHAPGGTSDPAAPYVVAHNLIRAHAKAWHVYNTHFRSLQKGQVSITLASHSINPVRTTPANVELCQKSMEAVIGWFAGPIHGEGDYPTSLKISSHGLIPEFSPEEMFFIQGTADFFALSFGPHTLRLGKGLPLFGQKLSLDLRQVLGWIQLEYDNPAILVAESGWFSNAHKTVEDTVAIYLLKGFINQVLQAIVYDSVPVFGYTAWSLVDGFEWNFGYTMRTGLFHVDFNSTGRNRAPKTTAKFYKQVITDNGFPQEKIQGYFPCDFQWGVTDSILQVNFHPYSPQFRDPHLYRWNFSGDGLLHPVSGVTLSTRGAQCTDFLSIQRHLHLIQLVGVSHYSFSLDWSLLLPHGDPSNVDSEVLRYYRCVLSELHKLGVKATVTLYHRNKRSPSQGMPEPLYAAGGWLNRGVVEAFEGYATLCFKELSAWVSVWITIMEPNQLAKTFNGSKEQQQRIERHVLLAHAGAWHIYDTQYRPQYGAQVSFALHANWGEPANPFVKSHEAAARRFMFFELGRFLDPILTSTGERHPSGLQVYLGENGFAESRTSPLLHFTDQEKQKLRGTMDFIALNHFRTFLVSQQQPPPLDHEYTLMIDHNWHISAQGQTIVPWGLRKVLTWVKDRYRNAWPVVVTAMGVDDGASQDDQLRQRYITEYLQEALKARDLDGVELRGVYIWSLQDRHALHFGLFTSPQHQSRAKGSAEVYRRIIGSGGFPGDGETRRACRRRDCALCAAAAENKALLFFGFYILFNTSMYYYYYYYYYKKSSRD
uniref:Klotho beta n=1 Tax=Denticeps clupeoides TaxID=299321 RepID=A0AAY4EE72_9TELE